MLLKCATEFCACAENAYAWLVVERVVHIEGSAGGLHEGVAVRELDSNGHDGEKIHSLDGNLVEGVDREVALVPLVTV